jgi:ABC-2 type transport system ATP-binding protein
VRLVVSSRSGAIAAAVRRLDDANVGIDDIVLRRPTLDDVFLTLTGRSLREEAAAVDGADDGPASAEATTGEGVAA